MTKTGAVNAMRVMRGWIEALADARRGRIKLLGITVRKITPKAKRARPVI